MPRDPILIRSPWQGGRGLALHRQSVQQPHLVRRLRPLQRRRVVHRQLVTVKIHLISPSDWEHVKNSLADVDLDLHV